MTAPRQRFCEECGFELSPKAKFCGGCGTKLGGSAAPAKAVEPEAVPVEWMSTDEDVDLSDFPYAEAAASSFIAGAVMLGAAMSTGGAPGESAPPLFTTWLGSRDEGCLGRCDQMQLFGEIFGSFARSVGLLQDSWDALEIATPLGNRGLVMVSMGDWPDEPSRDPGWRILVPLAYEVDASVMDREQARQTVNWILDKMASPYMNYVPVVMDDSQREQLMQDIVERSGQPVPGPLSDVEWLGDPFISAVGSNLRGFPGSGALRIGILDECEYPRQRAVFRSGELTLVDLEPGTVDIYAGWQVPAESVGAFGLMALGHRSLLGVIDAVAEVDGLQEELGGRNISG